MVDWLHHFWAVVKQTSWWGTWGNVHAMVTREHRESGKKEPETVLPFKGSPHDPLPPKPSHFLIQPSIGLSSKRSRIIMIDQGQKPMWVQQVYQANSGYIFYF